jgi:hypothetical protein
MDKIYRIADIDNTYSYPLFQSASGIIYLHFSHTSSINLNTQREGRLQNLVSEAIARQRG